MHLFRFLDFTTNRPCLGIEDDAGGSYNASAIYPEVFHSVAAFLASPDPLAAAETVIRVGSDERRAGAAFFALPDAPRLPPVDEQEVWAAGVTYERSKAARVEESAAVGGGDFYDRVYDAPRPELFFKSAGWRVRGDGGTIRVRRDSEWNVPEPELVLCLSSRGEIVGYAGGNDVSSRSIEGENPLYLPQAKTYDGACALGRVRLVAPEDAAALRSLAIGLRITRGDKIVFAGETNTARMRRTPEDLAAWLFRESSFPAGAFLFTGTGVVPDPPFTLLGGDVVAVTVEGAGVLTNRVGAP